MTIPANFCMNFDLNRLPKSSGEGMRVEVAADVPRAFPKEYECDEDAKEYIEKRQPQKAHAKRSGIPAEAYDGGCADECRTVRQRHDGRVYPSAAQHEVLRVFCSAPAEEARKPTTARYAMIMIIFTVRSNFPPSNLKFYPISAIRHQGPPRYLCPPFPSSRPF